MFSKNYQLLILIQISINFICAQDSSPIFSQCWKRNQNENDLIKENLRGKLKSITAFEYASLKDTVIDKNEFSEFDEMGNYVYYKADYTYSEINPKYLTTSEIKTFKYDKKHNLILQTYYNEDTSFLQLNEYFYKSDNKLSYSNTTSFGQDDGGNRLYTYSKVIYDNWGNCIEKNEPNERKIFLYNSEGCCVKIIDSFYDADHVASLSTTSLNYDSFSKLIRSSQMGYGNSQTFYKSETIYKFDDLYKLIEKIDYDSAYNQKITTIFKYDDYKNIMEIKSLDSKGNITQQINYIYKYDYAGNWIKKEVKSLTDEPYFIIRLLVYY